MNTDASRRGKKELESSREKKSKARTVVGRGGKSLLCDPASELRLGGGENRRAKIILRSKWDGREKKKKKQKRAST